MKIIVLKDSALNIELFDEMYGKLKSTLVHGIRDSLEDDSVEIMRDSLINRVEKGNMSPGAY